MPQAECGEITDLLKAWRTGDNTALDRLTPLIYNHLKHMAHRQMRNERGGKTLQTTALVHEAYLRLLGARNFDWKDRIHFFAVSAQMMRRILVSAARKRMSAKRGGQVQQIDHSTAIDLDQMPEPGCGRVAELIALDYALAELGKLDPRKVRVIELRFFGGLTVKETAEVLDISPQSVLRDWKLAKAWLKREVTLDSSSSWRLGA